MEVAEKVTAFLFDWLLLTVNGYFPHGFETLEHGELVDLSHYWVIVLVQHKIAFLVVNSKEESVEAIIGLIV